MEGAYSPRRAVALVVTDRRVLLLHTGLLRRQTDLTDRPLGLITDARVNNRPRVYKKDGALTIELDGHDGRRLVEIEHIRGGPDRARELVETILRQRDFLGKGVGKVVGGRPDRSDVNDLEAPDDPGFAWDMRVIVGRGVAKWVNAHGGTLYVWGEPFGAELDKLRASTIRPDHCELALSQTVTDFELFVESGLYWRRGIHLGRRWFGLRGGVEVDTGLV